MRIKRFQVDWLNNAVVSQACVHKDGWCKRPSGERVWPWDYDCFTNEESAWKFLISVKRQLLLFAEMNLVATKDSLRKALANHGGSKKRTPAPAPPEGTS